MQKTKFISRGYFFFFFFFTLKKKKKKNMHKTVCFREFICGCVCVCVCASAKTEKLSRSHEIISQSNFSIMSFERDNKSWPRENQPIRLNYGHFVP